MQTALDSTLVPDPIASASATTVRRWTGRVLTALTVAFLAFDIVIKLIDLPVVSEASAKLGIPAGATHPIAAILAVCLALYVVRRTAVLGAVLLTGYLGGAVFAHLRVGDPLLSHTVFPIYVGLALWAGLYLRDPRIRGLLAAR